LGQPKKRRTPWILHVVFLEKEQGRVCDEGEKLKEEKSCSHAHSAEPVHNPKSDLGCSFEKCQQASSKELSLTYIEKENSDTRPWIPSQAKVSLVHKLYRNIDFC
jgi:hypothetical protein